MATKRVYSNRSDIGSFAAGATSGDPLGWTGWTYKGLSWVVHGENRVLKPGHTFYVAGATLAGAQSAAALITARYP
jgi:hypothetical protein